MEKKHTPVSRRPPKFQLKRETIKYLGKEELSVVVGASGACCAGGCGTDGPSVCRCPPPP